MTYLLIRSSLATDISPFFSSASMYDDGALCDETSFYASRSKKGVYLIPCRIFRRILFLM